MFQFGKSIPVRIHPIFWLTAGVIGWLNSWSLLGTILWIGVILISLLVHEFGHALSARAFGQRAHIELVALGGLTYHDGKKIKLWQDFLVVLMGPLAGFMLFVATYFIRAALIGSHPILMYTLTIFVYVNLFWTIVNLLPIMPLDGGQLLRIIMEGIFGYRGLKVSLFIGILLGVGLAIAMFTVGFILLAAILLLLAFENFSTWNQIKKMTNQDQDEESQKLLEEAQSRLREGNFDDAMQKLEVVRSEAKEGLLFAAATEQLAFIFDKKGEFQKVYELLRPLEKDLSLNGRKLLHRAAFNHQDYKLTLFLGNRCFRDFQAYEIAFINAQASACLKDSKASVGWLECAINHGLSSLDQAVLKKEFDAIREDAIFKKFLETYKSN